MGTAAGLKRERWQQAHHSSDRAIGRKPAANIHHATRLAELVGYPLNQFVTINFSKTSCPPEEATAAFRKLLSSWFARWLRRHPKNKKGWPPVYVYAFEAAGGQTAVHWLVHVPRGLIREFWRLVPEWVTATAGTIESPAAIKHRRIYGLFGLKRYILKGMDPHFARIWKIRPTPQGLITGQRSGFSRSLGPAARSAANYRPQRHQAGHWSPAKLSPVGAEQSSENTLRGAVVGEPPMRRRTRGTDMKEAVGRINAKQARALAQESQVLAQREAEAEAVHYHGLVAQRISGAARDGETELHYPFADIPAAARLPVIRRLQEDGFQVHDDPLGGVVRWFRFGAG